ALRRKARSLDVRYLKAEATGFGNSKAVRLGDGSEVPFDRLVVAAGAWSAPVAAWLGIDLPVRARRRTVFVVDIRAPLPACPLIIDTSGVWLRPEGKQFICGASPPENRDPDDLPLEPDFDQWETTVWPALAARIPAFEAARMIRAWAGYYEYNTFDQNGVVGAYPDRPDVLFATGFSGHGLQHAPGVGRGVAELLVHGFHRGLDLGDLSPARLLAGRPLRERNVI
ncbi:MAG: FAD-binding oxidoreductase, partial [Alphaproteobacteria bacterium]|nr:FAD-binding oxidoreductase [Alphaproteobacteria bacterium]